MHNHSLFSAVGRAQLPQCCYYDHYYTCLNIDDLFFFSVEVSTDLFCIRDKALTHIFQYIFCLIGGKRGRRCYQFDSEHFFL